MAGPSRTYWRKDEPPAPVERTRINSYGKPETYLEWDVYLVNHEPGQHVMDADGVCIANPGMDPDYYAQGPEHGYGGPQTTDYVPPEPPPPLNPPSTPTLSSTFSTTDDPDIQLTASSTGASSYEFQRDVVADFSGATTLQNNTSNTCTDTQPVAGTYYYRVRATNSDGTSSWSSTETAVIVLWEPSHAAVATWYDASDSTDTNKVIKSSTNISTLKNLGSLTDAGYDLVQATAASQPTVGTWSSGLDSARFTADATGANSKTMFTSDGFGVFGPASTDVTEINVFIVAKTHTLTPANTLKHAGAGVGNGTSGKMNSHLPWSGGQVFWDLVDSRDNGTNGRSVSNVVIAAGDTYIHNLVNSVSTGNRRHFHNGLDETSTTSTGVPKTSNLASTGSFQLGSKADIEVGEMLNYNAVVSETLRERTLGYLAHKWGIDNLLDPGGTDIYPTTDEVVGKRVRVLASGGIVLAKREAGVSNIQVNFPQGTILQISGYSTNSGGVVRIEDPTDPWSDAAGSVEGTFNWFSYTDNGSMYQIISDKHPYKDTPPTRYSDAEPLPDELPTTLG